MWRWLLILVAAPALTSGSEYSELYDDISSYDLYMSAMAYWDLNNITYDNDNGLLDTVGFCQTDGIGVLMGAAELTNLSSWPKMSLGLSASMVCPVSPAACLEGFTVALWLSLKRTVDDALPTSDCMLLSLNDTSEKGIQILFSPSDNTIRFAVGGQVYHSHQAYNATGTWVWNHLGLTYKRQSTGAEVKVFANGEGGAVDLLDPAPELTHQACSYMALDEVALWDWRLNATEMLSLRLDPFNGTEGLWTTEPPSTEPPTTEPPTTEPPSTRPPTTTAAVTTARPSSGEPTSAAHTTEPAPSTTEAATTPAHQTTGATTKPGTTSETPTTAAPSTRQASTSASTSASTPPAEESTVLVTSAPAVTTAPSTTPLRTTTPGGSHTDSDLTLPAVADKIKGSENFTQVFDYLAFLNDYLAEKGDGIPQGDGQVTEDIFQVAAVRLTGLAEDVTADDRHSFLELFMNIVDKVIEINRNVSEQSLWDNEVFIKGTALVADVEEILNVYLATGADSALTQQLSSPNTVTQLSVFSEGQDKLSMTLSQQGSADGVDIVIPSSIFTGGAKGRVAGTTYFIGIDEGLPPAVASRNVSRLSPVVSILINSDSTDNFQESVSIVANSVPVADHEEAMCAYLKQVGEETVWSTEGCTTTTLGSSSTRCECNHLTNFAVLVSPRPIEVSEGNEMALNVLTYLGLTISIICLIFTLVILNWLRQLNSTRISILKHTSASLLCAQTLFLIGSIHAVGQSPVACKIIAALTHYSFLAVFCWMLLQGVYMFMKVRRATKSNIGLIYFCLFGWGLPLLIVGISFGAEYGNYGIGGVCWISVENGVGPLVAFIGPAYFILLVNIVVVGLVLQVFMSVKANKDKSEIDKVKSGLKAVIVMVPILGLTWLFGILMISGSIVFVYLFVIFNVLQGAALFLSHIVFNEEVKQALVKKRNKIAAGQDSTTLFSKVIRTGADPSTCDNSMASGKF